VEKSVVDNIGNMIIVKRIIGEIPFKLGLKQWENVNVIEE
jgi:hypothetical protein